ncbi:MAG: hypothetical protein CSA22_10115 [Deltaproteobacteria bacterium]|nr:MAG: hypothetical protein CSA22_10115 [Deltaproteobacteria bacterium]
MAIQLAYDASGAIHHASEDENNLLTEVLGDGYFSHVSAKHFAGISISDFTPQKTVVVKETGGNPQMCTLSFCLGSGISWSLSELRRSSFYLGQNESCIITGETRQSVSVFEAGQRYRGIGITFNPSYIQGVAECLRCEKAINCHQSLTKGLKRYVVTPRVMAILSQMMDCQICDGLKDIYVEGKLLELLAVYLDEMVCGQHSDLSVKTLSKSDLNALYNAKNILDRTFVEPLTLSELSRKVYLNEYKLKTGFKHCFGKTIYAYVIDKRMEMARALLEQRRFTVGAVAGLVGYSNTSHFISRFSKKYGVTPGEFARLHP